MTEREMARKKAAARKARKERERKARNRRVVTTVALMLVVCVASIGGTIAWLTDKTESVVNTFSPSTIGISLTETKPANKTAKMVPGVEIEKDPKVTVAAGSEPCWVFVKIEESSNFDNFFEAYTVNTAWTALDTTNYPGVYYIQQNAVDGDDEGTEATTVEAAKTYEILTGNKVTVKTSVTKADMDALKTAGASQPTLSFTAYAIQQEKFGTAAAAWAELNPPAQQPEAGSESSGTT